MTMETNKDVDKNVRIQQYNQHMKGVDRTDKCLFYYRIIQKTNMWTMEVICYLINYDLFNLFQIRKVFSLSYSAINLFTYAPITN